MDKKLEYAKRWFDDELTLTIDNAAEARQAAQEVLEWTKSRFELLFE